MRGTRSTRASWPGSVRWLVAKSRNVPSGLHAIESANALARNVAGRITPPATGTSSTLVNRLAPIANSAIQRPSGDQTGVGVSMVSAKIPLATTRSVPAARSITCSSLRLRRNASCLPSGENTGERSVTLPVVSAADAFAAKSCRRICWPAGVAET